MFVLRASLYKKPKGLQPKRFMGEQITENFVRSIRSGTTAWRQLIGSHSSYRGWRRSHPHAAIELYITRALLSGDIHVYLMPDMAALNATKKQRQAHQANGKRIQFVPASYLLDNQAAQVQEIQTAQQADDVIAGCNFLPKQYSELAKALHLNNEPQALQKALQSGQVAIIKDDEPGKPQVWEIVEEVVNSAGMLGPHDGIEVDHVRQTPIISVAPQKVLVADKADMSLSVIATNSAYFIGGMTKLFGDTVTGTVAAIAANPADILYDTLLSVADVVTYPIDILITPFGYTTGAVARTHDRINDADNNLIAFGEEFSNNWAQRDWEALGSNVVAIPLAVSPRALVKRRGTTNKAEPKFERGYLNEKFGRTGDLNKDINLRGNKEVAANYYRDSGYSDLDMISHLNGIDFTKTVEVVKVGKGKSFYQWDSPTTFRGGEYFAISEKSVPSQLGINPKKIGFGTNTVFTRIQSPLLTNKPVYGLKSFAAPIKDIWSVKNQPFMAQGGAQQLFTRELDAFSLDSRKYYGE